MDCPPIGISLGRGTLAPPPRPVSLVLQRLAPRAVAVGGNPRFVPVVAVAVVCYEEVGASCEMVDVLECFDGVCRAAHRALVN